MPLSCELVERHESEALSNDDLWQRLRSIDLESATHIHPNDRRKVKRYLSPRVGLVLINMCIYSKRAVTDPVSEQQWLVRLISIVLLYIFSLLLPVCFYSVSLSFFSTRLNDWSLGKSPELPNFTSCETKNKVNQLAPSSPGKWL